MSLRIPLPAVVKHYNMFMGGVDNSDQLISYHRVTQQTQKYIFFIIQAQQGACVLHIFAHEGGFGSSGIFMMYIMA